VLAAMGTVRAWYNAIWLLGGRKAVPTRLKAADPE